MGFKTLKMLIDRKNCISCGTCSCPDLFKKNKEDLFSPIVGKAQF